jgi:protease-4
MNLETDLLLDRRRLKRRLFFWRGFAVLALVAAVLGVTGVGWPGGDDGGAYVARLNVNGLVLDSRTLTERIVALAKKESARALIVSIDSPGGTVGGGESLYRALSLVAEKKPVVAVMRGTAASAAYMIAMPAARIFARDSTITGSIGVKLETAEISGLMRILGVSAETIASGPLKDQPSLTHPTSAEGRAVLQALITDMYEQFVEMVARGRHMEMAVARQLADGRAYTGRQALKLGLIDAIGGEAEARAWLADAKKISVSLPVRDVATQSLTERLRDVGGESLWGGLWKTLFSQRVTLDGAWAVWQPGQN